MGKKSKASTDKKKKGPKGKRARAKAKLERQWGEETNEESGSFKRAGRSRLLSRRKIDKPPEEHGDDYDSEDDAAVDALMPRQTGKSEYSDNDDGKEEMDLDNGGAYSKLLQTIRETEKDGDSDSEDDSDVEEDAGLSGKLAQDETEDEKGEEATDEVEEDYDFDPFGSRFSKEALPEDDTMREKVLQNLQQTKKVRIAHVDPLLELQVSQPLLEEMKVDDSMPPSAWKNLSKVSFSCNRDSLKRCWTETQKKNLSSWQNALYPFMTRYADCLIACNSAKVRTTQSWPPNYMLRASIGVFLINFPTLETRTSI